MPEILHASDTSYYHVESTKTDIKSKFKNRSTPSIFQRINPILSATYFYERYKGLNLLLYQRIMDTSDFEIFIDYVGGENIGVKRRDFEVYYPED